MERRFKPLKSERMQIRLDLETQWRIKELARAKRCSMTALIERLVDDAWLEQIAIAGMEKEIRYPD